MSELEQQRSASGDILSADRPEPVITDQRLLRGAQTRRTIARHAVDVASMEGLNGLSLGRLATDLGLSKSGVQTLFGTKENLQLAAIDCAREEFVAAVVRPVRGTPHGTTRLRALIEHWIAYAEQPLFPGGCFRAANIADFDSRPGPVRDALVRDQTAWVDLLAAELRAAADAGEIADLDVDFAAFQIDAVLCAANTALRLGDEDAPDKVRRVVEGFLAPPR
ncbi:TetR family transcriptional regulator C-terminal domain-containing protein [Nocardia xishanensis]|uniref:TetR/AcrR family transcriptional regulator n=1 Tax=Nocardia xishanensis TaxID=238964 RepID=A0ABW7X4T6_9NOCA